MPKVAPIPPPPPPAATNAQLSPQLNINNNQNKPGALPAFRSDLTIPYGGGGQSGLNIPT